MPDLSCPQCQQTLRIPMDLLEVPVTCSLCDTLFWPMTGIIVGQNPEPPRQASWETEEPRTALQPQASEELTEAIEGHAPDFPVETGYRECPYCAEQVQTRAVKCKHCGEFLEQVLAVRTPEFFVRCFDCGQSFLEQDIVRQEVRIGRSYGRSRGSFGGGLGLLGPLFGGFTSGTSSSQEYGKVDLCMACFRKRASGCGCLSAAVLFVAVFIAAAAPISVLPNQPPGKAALAASGVGATNSCVKSAVP